MNYLKQALILCLLSFLLSCGGDNQPQTELFPVEINKKYGFVDRQGEIKIKPQFKGASVFADGLSLVRSDGDKSKVGYINTKGELVISPKYMSGLIFREGIAIVVEENKPPMAIDEKGVEIFKLPQAEMLRSFHEGFAAFAVLSGGNQKLWGFVNTKGEVVIEPLYTGVGIFSEKRCAVCNDDNEWGYIDNKGNLDINYQFEYAGAFSNGQAVVSAGKSGLIDEKGKYIINPQFDKMEIDGDIYMVRMNGKVGWVSKKGKFLINPQFDYAHPFFGARLAPVKMDDDDWGYINIKGKYEINPQFTFASSFDGNLAVVKSGSKFGMINKKGKFEVNPQFTSLSKSYWSEQEYVNEHRYGGVTTDFFNVQAIADSINLTLEDDLFSGVGFQDSLSSIMESLDISEHNFRQYGQQFIVWDKNITKFVHMEFSVGIPAYKTVKVPKKSYYGTYYHNKNVLDESAKPKSFGFKIILAGKASGKHESVIEKVTGNLSSYKLIKNKENGIQEYENGKYKMTISSGLYNKNVINVRFYNI